MFKIRLYLFVLGFFVLVLGKPVVIFCTETQIVQQIDPDKKISLDSLFSLAEELVFNNPDSARTFISKGYELAKKAGVNDIQIRFLNLFGTSYAVQSDFYHALVYYHQALDIAIETQNYERMANAYNNLGNINLLTGNYKIALENFLEAKNLYETMAYSSMIASVHNSIGALYEELNNLDKALDNYQIAISGFRKMENCVGINTTLNNLGSVYLRSGKPDSALMYYNQAIQNELSCNDFYNLCHTYLSKANMYNDLGDFASAVEYYLKSKKVAEDIQNQNQIANATLGLAYVKVKLHQIDSTFFYLDLAMEQAQSVNDIKLIQKAHELYASIYEKTGNYRLSLEHVKEAFKIKQQLINQSELHQIYNTEILQLSRDKEMQQMEIERQQIQIDRRNFTLAMVSIVSISVVIIIFLVYHLHLSKLRHRQNLKMNELVVKHMEENAKSSFEAEVQERKRLGMELHDGVGPLLSLAKLNVTTLIENPEMNLERRSKIINNILIIINEILKEMKQISHNMAPLILLEKGFESAVREMAIMLNESHKYVVTLDIFGLNGQLEPYVEHVLYRAMQEIVGNIIQHSKGREMSIQIVQNDEDLTIMVEDDGVGFDQKSLQSSKGLGLKSTISRIKSLNGQLFIDSVEGKGTIISIIVPIKK